MQMTPVNSSSIHSLHHDPSTNTLTVKFRNGKTYEFDDVTAEKHSSLIGADSIGKHFNTHIRYHHDYRQV